MNVKEMSEDFRNQYPEITKAADTRHLEIWGRVEDEAAFVWFESLAYALNAQMGFPERGTDFPAIFNYFDTMLRAGSKEVKNCIDVSFVENLFWEVIPKNATPVWATLPKSLQQIYIDFHGRPPKLG